MWCHPIKGRERERQTVYSRIAMHMYTDLSWKGAPLRPCQSHFQDFLQIQSAPKNADRCRRLLSVSAWGCWSKRSSAARARVHDQLRGKMGTLGRNRCTQTYENKYWHIHSDHSEVLMMFMCHWFLRWAILIYFWYSMPHCTCISYRDMARMSPTSWTHL